MSATALRVLIVEDEPQARENLRQWLGEAPAVELVGEAADGVGAVERIDALRPDLVLLDVSLPECSGLEVAARIRHRPEIVFTTAHDEHAVEAFELGALDYLTKPFGRRRLLAALERVRRRMATPGSAADRIRETGESPLRRLFARTPRGIVPIEVRAIRHLRASGDYVEVYAESGRFLVHMGLAELAARLDPEQFRQVHRSHWVNLDAVEIIERHDARRLVVRLRDGTRIVASRAASEKLRSLAR